MSNRYNNRSRNNRGGRGNGRGRGNPQRPNQSLPPPRPEEIESEQRRAISESFSSSELSYGGSDAIVSVPHGGEYVNAWKRWIKKEFVNQHQMRRFITSCIVDAKKVGYELDTLVEELGSSDGMKKIREIVMSPVSVDAGSQYQVASFQRVILPFLALLTRQGIIE
ncbi:11389_t:CDS:1, partial [Acaulospora colombiana]